MSLDLSAALLALVSVALTAASLWLRHRLRHPRRVDLGPLVEEAARALGLAPRGATRHVGRVEGVQVEVVRELPRLSGDPLPDRGLLRVAAVEELAVPIQLGAESPLTWLGAQDLAIGELRFDEVVHLQTRDEAVARALFDGPTRDATLAAVQEGLRFEGGRWSLVREADGWTPAELVASIRRVARAQAAFALRAAALGRLPEALRDVARSDRHPGVRAQALELLLARGLADPDTLRDRCRDLDPAVRRLAAGALGPEGLSTLAADLRAGSRTVRVRAASALAEQGPLPPGLAAEVEACLIPALDDPELALPALEGLARVGTAACVAALRRAEGGDLPVGLRGRARQALARVRSRLDPSAAGALALAEMEGGALSLADDDGGDPPDP